MPCCGKRRGCDFAAAAISNQILTFTGLAGIIAQTHSAIAYPPVLAGGNASDESVVRYVVGNNSAGCDKCIAADGCATHYRAVCSERGSPFHQRPVKFMFANYVTARIDDIRKNHRRAAEHIALQLHTFIDGDIVLNFDAISHDYPGADDDVLA